MSSLYVGNLSSHVRHRELENVFRRFGRSHLELKDGYGFVVYEEFQDAQKALTRLQGRSVCGEQPSIKWARGKRPFPRNTGRGTSTRRGSWDKHQRQPFWRGQSVETARRSDECGEDVQVVDEVWDASRASNTRENAMTSDGKREKWREEDLKDVDVEPFDSGRWDPRMEDSPLFDGLMEDEEKVVHGKDMEDESGGEQKKAHGSPAQRHNERNSRDYPNSSDHIRRRRDVAGRFQERCYNCGKFGHVKWQCRSRLRGPSMRDGRRIESRYGNGRGGFRGAVGRFKSMNASGRMLHKDVKGEFTQRSSRRHDTADDRRHRNPLDAKFGGKAAKKGRHHGSESPKDDSGRGRSKRKHKKATKDSSRKRKRSSAPSSPSSSSTGHSSPSESKSSSWSASASPSAASSGSSSSRSVSRSSSSRSPSPVSKGQSSSRSRSSASASSLSRSRSASSKKSIGKSISGSPCHLHSPRSNGIGLSDCAQDSRCSRREEEREGAIADKPTLQSKHVSDFNHERDKTDDGDGLPESGDNGDRSQEQEEVGRRERRQASSREVKKQKSQTKSDTEVHHHAPYIDTNGGTHAVNSRIRGDTQCSIGQNAECVAMDPTAPTAMDDQIIETKYNIYMAIRSSGTDGGQEVSTDGFAMARMWPWNAILFRRLKRGLISTANYERRRAQNLEFGIEDKFVRSSSGWWDEEEEKLTND